MIVLAVVVSAQPPDGRIVQVELGCAEELDDPLEFHSPPAIDDTVVVEQPVLEPNVRPFLDDLFMAPMDIDLVMGGEMGAGKIDVANPRLPSNERKESAKPGDHATAGGDAGDGDDAIVAKLGAYWANQSFQTMQSCSVDPIDGNEFVAQAKLWNSHTVLAVDHYGKGRIAYYCDMTTLKDLMRAFPDLIRYLGQRPKPKVLVFGYRFLCQPLDSLPGFQYAGTGLPRRYDGNPSALAKDYDVVIFGAGNIASDPLQFEESWGATLRAFTELEGRGLVLVGDYHGGFGICPGEAEFDALNSIANAAGARFNKVNLSWARAAWRK